MMISLRSSITYHVTKMSEGRAVLQIDRLLYHVLCEYVRHTLMYSLWRGSQRACGVKDKWYFI